ncbi:MAG: hypothetical protein HYU36_03400 [Planctomycetes bacterium]|nr:hypothetical protein [Planctomycetota bacterium]
MADPQTRLREVSALGEAMAELKLQTGIIVTRNEDDLIETHGGRITMVPAWRFLLDLPEARE